MAARVNRGRTVRSGGLFVACALVLGVLLAFGGCKKKQNQDPPEQTGSIHRDAGMSGPSDPRYGSSGQQTVTRPTGPSGGEGTSPTTSVSRTYKQCPKPQPVTKGDLKTPEGTLYFVFEALLEPDDDTAFRKFFAHIDSDYQREADARRYWFAAARKNGGKAFKRLVYGDKNPSFDICMKRPEGAGVRIFVAKSPPVGSNPPFVLHKVEDKWLLKTFTPH
jgi:hypothetical protein